MILILTQLFTHWIFDFNIQTTYQASNKSKSNKALFSHVNEYSLGMLVSCWIALMIFYQSTAFGALKLALIFWIITFICHFITDYCTSRITSKRYADQKYYGWNGFFSWIGFDQFLHTVQIILTLRYIVDIYHFIF